MAGYALFGGSAWAELRLPKLFSDGMVLQRDGNIAVWGWADPGEEIRIDFHGQKVKARAGSKGQWSAALGPYPAGGPYEMVLTGKKTVTLRDVLIGDVWLASGQSNMEFSLAPVGGLRGVNNAEREIAGAHFPAIRLFTVKHNAAVGPVSELQSDGWREATPESVAGFSAVAYLFGRDLHERYHVPIGLIQSSWGATAVQSWMSAAALRPFAEFHAGLESLAHFGPESQVAPNSYLKQRSAWYQRHGTEDRGRVEGHDLWADPELDVSHWPTLPAPRPSSTWTRDFNGFRGPVWFRRVLNVPSERAGKDLLLHLGRLVVDDQTYFNTEKIGETRAAFTLRDYRVPGKYVRAGENVIAVRLVGTDDLEASYIGMFGPEESMFAEVDGARFSLAGDWSYQPGADLRDFPVPDAARLAAQPSPTGPPTVLFNGMINPLVSFRIKGVIWYQGESNATTHESAQQYRALFPALIEDWRRQWGYAVPFLFVQLAGFGPNESEPADYSLAELREAQSMALALPGTAMATAVDIGDEGDIHPMNKQDVAYRLAAAAAKVAYGEDIVYSGPRYQSMELEGQRIRIRFSELGSGLLIKDKYGYVRGFEIAGADGHFIWAQARQDGQDVVVASDAVREPITVRYDWTNTPDGNVYNREGFPAVPFRTDAPKY